MKIHYFGKNYVETIEKLENLADGVRHYNVIESVKEFNDIIFFSFRPVELLDYGQYDPTSDSYVSSIQAKMSCFIDIVKNQPW